MAHPWIRFRSASLAWLAPWLLLCCGCGGCQRQSPAPPAPSPQIKAEDPATSDHDFQLVDVAQSSGIEFAYASGREPGQFSLLPWMGGGVAIADFDRDGRPDVFFAGGGRLEEPVVHGAAAALFRNFGGWQFREVTSQASLGQSPHYSLGCEAGDYDNDGFIDILVTGYGGLQLFHNEGDGSFTEVAHDVGLLDDAWSTSAAWGDIDGDGNLDLYVVHYVDWSFENDPICTFSADGERDVCPPQQFAGVSDTFYRNQGDGTFRDATADLALRPLGKGLGVVTADVDQDGDLDIYVANDTTDNFLYLNQGAGQLAEAGLVSGVAGNRAGAPDGSMGVDVGDYDRDGKLDIWVTNFLREPFALYRNLGDSMFQHSSGAAGVNQLGGLYIGFGTGFADLDRDGDEDLVMTNGHIQARPPTAPVKQLSVVLRNDDGRYRALKFPRANYFSTPQLGRGLALGDLDEDGDLDIVISHLDDPAAVIRNDDGGESSHWLQLALVGRTVNRDAIGATATLHTTAGDQIRTIKGGGSYMSHSDARITWGIPANAEPTAITIAWPDGSHERLEGIQTDTFITRVQP